MKVARGEVGDDLGERGFADAGRAPEDEAGCVIIFDLQAERLAGSEEMRLAEELVERAGTHALGERRALGCGVGGGVEVGGEETHRDRDEGSRVRRLGVAMRRAGGGLRRGAWSRRRRR